MGVQPLLRNPAVKNHGATDGFEILGHPQQGRRETEGGVGGFAFGVGEMGDRVERAVGVVVAVDQDETHGLAG